MRPKYSRVAPKTDLNPLRLPSKELDESDPADEFVHDAHALVPSGRDPVADLPRQ